METSEPVKPELRTALHHKYLPDVTGQGFQFDSVLVDVPLEAEVDKYETGAGTVPLADTTHDLPGGEMTVEEPSTPPTP